MTREPTAAEDQPGPACLHAIVHGRVQGVFFRYFVERRARALGLEGFVRNLPDGRAVEVMAEGDRARLEELLKHLQTGPRGARVDGIDVAWAGYSGDYPLFEVRR